MGMVTDGGIDCPIPCGNTTTVAEEIGRFAAGMREIGSTVTISDGNDRVRYAGVIAGRKRRTSAHCDDTDLPPHGRHILSATNNPDPDVEECARRRGIETGCRMTGHARPKTRSRNAELHAFRFLYGIVPFTT